LIVGAGVAAFAAALRCARQGLVVTVLVPARRQWPAFPETLSVSGLRTLLRLGLARSELARNFPEVREHRSRWGNTTLQVRPRVPGLPSPVILGKGALISMLRTAALECGAQILEIDRLVAARETDSGVLVSFTRDGAMRAMACGYAIDASGRPALLARQMGSKRKTLDDLVAFVIHGAALPQFAACVAIISIADGWTFWTSDASGQAALSFFTAGRALAGRMDPVRLLARAPAEIESMMAHAATWATSAVASFNCSTSRLDRSGGVFWLACGDALQTFDPLASTGVATALQQADQAAQAIAAALMGERSLIASYGKDVQQSFGRYIAERNAYYGA
jgi:flavin-dependent dehydrogenase